MVDFPCSLQHNIVHTNPTHLSHFFGEYTGEITDKQDPDSVYTMEVTKGVFIDAKSSGNTIRFVNHRCNNSNSYFLTVVSPSNEKTVFLKAQRDIMGGEYISVDYGPCL